MKIIGWKIGSGLPKPVSEFKAAGEIERVYHEIRQSLRVTGVNLNLRTWAAFEHFLPAMWDEVRPNVETTVFERAANQIRAEALQAAGAFPQAESQAEAGLGESRSYQIRAALDLYHDINPKLLVLTSAVAQALHGEHIGSDNGAGVEKLPRGEPAKMFAMEMEPEKPGEKRLRHLFRDIRKTLSLQRLNSDYRTLALWPDYLRLAWSRLKPICRSADFQRAGAQLREHARALARSLPFPISLTLGRVKELGDDPQKVLETTRAFEQLLPGLILNIAVLQLDWQQVMAGPRDRRQSGLPLSQSEIKRTASPLTPTLSPLRGEGDDSGEAAWRGFQKRQHVLELGDRFISYIDEGAGEPVVLLHGIPTWGFLWRETIGVLNNRQRVLVPDLLGFGYSEKRDCFDRSLARQTEMVDAFLSKLGVQSAHFIGHDLGGGIALRMAVLFPQRVRSLCLLNSVCYDSWPIARFGQLGQPAVARQASAAEVTKWLRTQLAPAFHSSPDPEWLDGLFSPWRTEVGKLSLIRAAAALNTNHTSEITHLLPGLSVPTLVVWGEEDRFQLVKYGQLLADDIPGAHLVRIAGASHFVMIDQPARVHSTIQDFLRRVVAPTHRAAA